MAVVGREPARWRVHEGAAAAVIGMSSAGHRANVVNPNLHSIGTGAIPDGPGRWCFLAEFGAR